MPHHFGARIPLVGHIFPIQIVGVIPAWNHAQNKSTNTKTSVNRKRLKDRIIALVSLWEKFQVVFLHNNLCDIFQ